MTPSSSKPLDIVSVCLSGLGGSGIVAAEVAEGLAGLGHRVRLVSDAVPFRVIGRPGPVEVCVASVPGHPVLPGGAPTIALASEFVRQLELRPADVVHVHYAVPNVAAFRLAAASLDGSPPLVVTFHGSDVVPVGSHPSYREITRRGLRSALVTAPSKHLAGQVEDVFALERERVEVIPNFVDLEAFDPTLAPAGPGLRLAHVSNFRPVKRAEDALLAFERLAFERQDVDLYFVGDGPGRPALERRARAGDFSGRVHFLGVRRDVPRLLGDMDVVLVPSERESFGLSALEGMAAGRPVLATRVGGLVEVVEHEETGLFIEVGDVDAMTAALRRLADDRALRARLGRAGRLRAETRFRRGRALEAYASTLRRAAEREPSP